MIELAPRHKTGLNLSGPVMIAAGFCGYGDAYQHLIDLSVFGAVVTRPITLKPQRGAPQPRVAETRAGFILDTGQQNPGVKKVLDRYRRVWSRLGVPVIAHLPADEPDNLTRTTRALTSAGVVVAIELGTPQWALPEDISGWIGAIQAGCELPLLVKLPAGASYELAQTAVDNYADALVVGGAPLGTAVAAGGQWVTGQLYGPMLHSMVLHELQHLADFELPVVAVGGVHTVEDIHQFLKAGATAVQLDSLLFVDPRQAGEVVKAATLFNLDEQD